MPKPPAQLPMSSQICRRGGRVEAGSNPNPNPNPDPNPNPNLQPRGGALRGTERVHRVERQECVDHSGGDGVPGQG